MKNPAILGLLCIALALWPVEGRSQASATDLIESLYGFARQGPATGHDRAAAALDNELRVLLECIGYDPVHCDQIAERSGLTIDKVSSMLVTLELNDLIQSAPGGCFVRI